MQCYDPFYIFKDYTDYFVHSWSEGDNRENGHKYWLIVYILVQVRDEVVLDHGSDGGDEEQQTDLRCMVCVLLMAWIKRKGREGKERVWSEAERIEEMMCIICKVICQWRGAVLLLTFLFL